MGEREEEKEREREMIPDAEAVRQSPVMATRKWQHMNLSGEKSARERARKIESQGNFWH